MHDEHGLASFRERELAAGERIEHDEVAAIEPPAGLENVFGSVLCGTVRANLPVRVGEVGAPWPGAPRRVRGAHETCLLR